MSDERATLPDCRPRLTARDLPRPISSLLDVGAEPQPIVHRCEGGCDAPVTRRLDYCSACATKNAAELRVAYLEPAYRSLPDWPHARFGPELAKAVKSPAVLDAVDGWRRRQGGLVLLGPTGCGKTTAAVALAYRILDVARDRALPAAEMKFAAGMLFVSAKDLAVARRESKLGSMPALERAARGASLLILDELGYETRLDSTIDDLADLRYREGLPTIATSGLTEAEFAARYGDAVKRRLFERSVVVSVHPEAS